MKSSERCGGSFDKKKDALLDIGAWPPSWKLGNAIWGQEVVRCDDLTGIAISLPRHESWWTRNTMLLRLRGSFLEVVYYPQNVLRTLGKMEDVDLGFSSFLDEEIPWKKRISIRFRISIDIPIRYLLSLSLLTKRFKPDILYVHGCSISPHTFFLILSPFNSKRVVTVHSIPSQEAKGGCYGVLPRMLSFLYELVEKLALSRADRIIVLNNGRKRWIHDRYGREVSEKSVVVNNGVDIENIERILTMDNLTEEQRKHICVPVGSFVVFLAKGFVPCNGQEFLIRAMPELLRARSDIRLVLAGDGSTKTQMVKLSEDLGVSSNVIFLGTIPNSEVLRTIVASDVVVLPSIRHGGVEEGFSIFILESMASGKPVVATRVGGNLECIIHQENGILIPEGDSAAIASAVLTLHNNPDVRKSLGERARNYVIEYWTWSRNVEKVHYEYKQLLSGDGSRRKTGRARTGIP